jgi:hypothetical protein
LNLQRAFGFKLLISIGNRNLKIKIVNLIIWVSFSVEGGKMIVMTGITQCVKDRLAEGEVLWIKGQD